MRKFTTKFIALLMSLCLLLSAVPETALAYMVKGQDTAQDSENGVTVTDSSGNSISPDVTWESRFPYGTFAFEKSQVTLDENGATQCIKVYRLGGTKGKADVGILYNPASVTHDGTDEDYSYAISSSDISIRVEDPLPAAAYEAYGKDPDPEETALALKTEHSDADGSYTLSLDGTADSYQWYTLNNGSWKKVDGATDSTFVVGDTYYDKSQYDFRLQFTSGGTTYCTDSIFGVNYEKPAQETVPEAPADLNLNPTPTYSTLNLASDGEYSAWAFTMTFAEGEYVKNIYITAPDDNEIENIEYATMTMVACEGGELYNAADTLTLMINDDETAGSSTIGFKVSDVTVDKASGTADLTVERTGDSSKMLTVDYATEDGTAVAGTDYVTSSGSVAFYASSKSYDIKIDLINDSVQSDDDGYFTVKLSGLRGDDGSSISQDEIRVNLYNSNDATSLNDASLTYDSETVDVSAKATESEPVVDLSDDTVTGEQAAVSQPVAGTFDESDASLASYKYATAIDFGANKTTNSSIWTSTPALANILSGSPFTFSSKGAEYTGWWSTNNIGQYFSKVDLGFHWEPQFASSWTMTWHGLQYTYPYFELYNQGSVIASRNSDCSVTGSYLKGYNMSWSKTNYLSGTALPFNHYPCLFRLGTTKYDSEESDSAATAEIFYGCFYRRVFSNKISLEIDTPNDSNVVGSSGDSVYTDSDYTALRNATSVTISDGGTDGSGRLFVGSTLNVSFSKSGMAVNTDTNYGYAVYMTNSSGNVVGSSMATANGATYSASIKMLWDSLNANDLTQTYTLHIAMVRRQGLSVNIGTSAPNGAKLEDAYTLFKASSQNKDTSANPIFTIGYKTLAKNSNGCTSFGSNATKNVTATGYSSDGKLTFSTSTPIPDNIRYINFHLSHTDIVTFDGKLYNGDEDIPMSNEQLKNTTLVFNYYNEKFLSTEQKMTSTIQNVQLCYDDNANGIIDLDASGNVVTAELINDNLGGIDYDEATFQPVVDSDGTVHQYYLRVKYEIVPRYLVLPANSTELGIKDTDRAQVVPAFITDVTNSATLAKMTSEQKAFRYVKSGMKDATTYTSDGIVMYGGQNSNYVTIPLGGDTNPVKYTANNSTGTTTAPTGSDYIKAVTKQDGTASGWYTWSPVYCGYSNLINKFASPSNVYIANSLVGSNIAITKKVNGRALTSDGVKAVNQYLGSFADNDTFALTVQEQSKTTGNLAAADIKPESVTRGDVGCFPNTDYLKNQTSSNPSGTSGSDSGENDYNEFSTDFGVNPASFSFDGGDYFTISTDDYEVSLSVGIPLGGYESSKDSATKDGQMVKDPDSGRKNPKSANAGNKEDMSKAVQQVKNFIQKAKNGEGATKAFDALEDGGMKMKSMSFSVSFSVSLGITFKYNPLDNKYKFSEGGISVSGELEFTYQYRFTPVPLIYIYVTVDATAEVGTGFGRERETVEEANPDFNNVNGVSLKKNTTDNTHIFAVTTKAFNVTFNGKLYMQLQRHAKTSASDDDWTDYDGFVPGFISSDGSEKVEVVMLQQNSMDLPDTATYNYRVVLTPVDDTTLYKVARVTGIYDDFYWSGVKIDIEAYLEVGAGIGVELAKFELYAKVDVSFSFLLGVYNVNTHTYSAAEWQAFHFQLGLGFRIVFLFFNYEMDLIEYHVDYTDDNQNGKYDGSWSHGYSAFGGALGEDADLSSFTADDVKITLPGSNASTQQVYSNGVTGAEDASLESVKVTGIPFELSSRSSSSSAYKLADGLTTGYDYQVVSAGGKNYLVYMLSRPESDTTANEDYSMLVMSELVGTGTNGLVNPTDNTSTTPYIVVDDDGTGDLDFNAWGGTDGKIYVSWVNYRDKYLNVTEPTVPAYSAKLNSTDTQATEMTKDNYTQFPQLSEPTEPTAPDPANFYTTITYALYAALMDKTGYSGIGTADTSGNFTSYGKSASTRYENYTAAKNAYDAAYATYTTAEAQYQTDLADFNSYTAWYNYFKAVVEDIPVTLDNGSTREAKAARNTEVKVASFDTANVSGGFTALGTASDALTGTSGSNKTGYTFLPSSDGTAAFFGQSSGYYTQAELDTLTDTYTTYLKSQSSYADTSDATGLNNSGKYRLAYQKAMWNTYGKGSTLNFAYDNGSAWGVDSKVIPNGQIVTNVEFTKVGGTYYLAYTTEQMLLTESKLTTVSKLYLRTVQLEGTTVTWGDPYLIRTLYNYDDNTSNKDYVLAGGQKTEYTDPYFSNLRFLNAAIGDSLNGTTETFTSNENSELASAAAAENFLVFEMDGTVYVIRQADLANITSGSQSSIKTFFTASGQSASGVSDVTIGTDKAGNIAAAFVENVPNTTNNALCVSYFDSTSGTWSKGEMVAMNYMGVYESAAAEGWDDQTAEAAYYDTAKGGGMTQFKFSNVQIAFDGTPDSNKATLTVVSKGTGTSLVEKTSTSGDKIVMADMTKNSEVGFYSVAYGYEKNAKIDNAQVSFADADFSEGSKLGVSLTFRNAGDTALRYDSTSTTSTPIKVSLSVTDAGGLISQTIGEWNITKNIASGQKVELAGSCSALASTLTAGQKFVVSVTEGVPESPRTASADLMTIADKADLSVRNFDASIDPSIVDASGNVAVKVSMDVANMGSKNADGAYLQFTYVSGTETDGTKIYSVLPITGNTLTTSDAASIAELQSLNGNNFGQGIYQLKGDDGAALNAKYYRTVSGVLFVPAKYFCGAESNSLDLRVEAFSSLDDTTSYTSGVITAAHDEYSTTNNAALASVEQYTSFTAPKNIVIPLGSVLYLPITMKSTTGAQPVITTTEADGASNLGMLYWQQQSYANGVAQGYIIIQPSVDNATGTIHIRDTGTNHTYDIVYKVTPAGDGVNIFHDNKLFTFYDKDGKSYADKDRLEYQNWVFSATADLTWGNKEKPYNNDLSIANSGAYFTFDTLAESIALAFDGKINVTYTVGGTTKTLTGLTASGGGTPQTINFGNTKNEKVTVKVTAAADSTKFDTLTQNYSGGTAPTPSDDSDAPAIYWGRSYPDAASMSGSTSATVKVTALDLGGLASMTLDGTVLTPTSKYDDNLWTYDWMPTANGTYTFTATDKAGHTTTRIVPVTWFTSGTPAADVSSLSPDDFKVTVNRVDKNGSSTEFTGVYNRTNKSAGQALQMVVSSDADYAANLTYHVYFCPADGTTNTYDTELKADTVTGNFIDLQNNKNGYYRVVAYYNRYNSNDVMNGTWSAQNYAMSGIDGVPSLSIVQTNNTSAVSWSAKLDSNSSSISKAKVNTTDVLAGASLASDSRSAFGSLNIVCGGKYTLTITDSTGFEDTAVLEAVIPVTSKDGLVSTADSWDSADKTGSISIDASKLAGGKYAATSTVMASYTGSYQYAVVSAAAFKTATDFNPASGYTEWLDALTWKESGTAFTGLPSGDYKVIVRDKLDPENTTVMYTTYATVGYKYVTMTSISVRDASTAGNSDGQVTVKAQNSVTGIYEYAAVRLSDGAFTKSGEVGTISNPYNKDDIDLSAFANAAVTDFVAADWQPASGSADTGVLNGLGTGSYMIAVRPMRGVTSVEASALMADEAAVTAAKAAITSTELERSTAITNAINTLAALRQAWTSDPSSANETAFKNGFNNNAAVLAASDKWAAAVNASDDYYSANKTSSNALMANIKTAREEYDAAVKAYFTDYFTAQYATQLASKKTTLDNAQKTYDDAKAKIRTEAAVAYADSASANWNGVYYSVLTLSNGRPITATLTTTMANILGKNGSVIASDISGFTQGYQYAVIPIEKDKPYTADQLADMTGIDWKFASSAETAAETVSGLNAGEYQVVIRPIYGVESDDMTNYFALKSVYDQAAETLAAASAAASETGVKKAANRIVGLGNNWQALVAGSSSEESIAAAEKAFKDAVNNDYNVLAAYDAWLKAAGSAKTAAYAAYIAAVKNYVTGVSANDQVEAQAAFDSAKKRYEDNSAVISTLVHNAYSNVPGYWDNMFSGIADIASETASSSGTAAVTFVTSGGTAVPAQKVNMGDTATEPADPTRDGYTFAGWYTDEALTKPFDFGTKLYEATTLYAKWTANAAKTEFTDVSNHWAKNDIDYVVGKGIMDGVGSGLFSPDTSTTRAMIVTMLWRLEGKPVVNYAMDVANDTWYTEAVRWAASNGIVKGFSAEEFAPNEEITREQFAAILYRYAQFKGYDVSAQADLSAFTDASAISAYAVTAMRWANAAKLVSGVTPSTLVPGGSATRAQAATLFARFCENVAK